MVHAGVRHAPKPPSWVIEEIAPYYYDALERDALFIAGVVNYDLDDGGERKEKRELLGGGSGLLTLNLWDYKQEPAIQARFAGAYDMDKDTLSRRGSTVKNFEGLGINHRFNYPNHFAIGTFNVPDPADPTKTIKKPFVNRDAKGKIDGPLGLIETYAPGSVFDRVLGTNATADHGMRNTSDARFGINKNNSFNDTLMWGRRTDRNKTFGDDPLSVVETIDSYKLPGGRLIEVGDEIEFNIFNPYIHYLPFEAAEDGGTTPTASPAGGGVSVDKESLEVRIPFVADISPTDEWYDKYAKYGKGAAVYLSDDILKEGTD